MSLTTKPARQQYRSSPNPKPSKANGILASAMLTCLASLALLLFSRIGQNKPWFEKVGSYWDDFVTQRAEQASMEDIKTARLGPGYKVSKTIEQYFESKHIKNPVILLEPNSYVEKAAGFKMPEPVIFYFYTGMKSLWTNSSNVTDATHFVYFRNRQMYIDTIASKETLQKIIKTYASYPQAL